jgi:hypothetical protein
MCRKQIHLHKEIFADSKFKQFHKKIKWNADNTINHGTDVGWSVYGGGRISEVENLGVNFPPKNSVP